MTPNAWFDGFMFLTLYIPAPDLATFPISN
jgi:hypothetical protein